MLSQVSDYYSSWASTSSSLEITGKEDSSVYNVERESKVTRISFLLGGILAIAYTIRAVAAATIILIMNLFTAFQMPKLTNALSKGSLEVPMYFLAAVLGSLGILFPETIQSKVLEIASNKTYQTQDPVAEMQA